MNRPHGAMAASDESEENAVCADGYPQAGPLLGSLSSRHSTAGLTGLTSWNVRRYRPPHAARDANDSDQESFQVCERACKQLIPIETASDQLLLTKNPLPIQKIRA
ncbi:hypothetical protein [Pseudomonas sp. JUb96]|uniref:hypothetical protein n=1 Tax=Pseudomonas sp. JUb96 TaxID=2940539 RepID=UPI002225DC8B|nr:hypothetical protein [Pseudomonas sp. JUb96]MCW2270629.1 hypothetical protein [Pseudomonas sp. JUb96]